MKILIWVLTIFIGTAINALLGAVTKIKAGAFLLYLVEVLTLEVCGEHSHLQ